jgi:serine protease
MKRLIYLGLMLLLANACLSQSVYPHYQDGKVWFKLKDNHPVVMTKGEDPYNISLRSLDFTKQALSGFQITRLKKPFYTAKTDGKLLRTYELWFNNPQEVDLIIEALKSCPQVEYAEKVPYDQLFLTPNDYNASNQWYLQKINATGAWNYFSTGSTAVVAIVDNAIQYNHTDLNANKWVNPGETANNNVDDDGNGAVDDMNGYDVSDDDNNPGPPNTSFNHGTHCAGDASASTNNGTGIAGIGFSVKIMSVKATSDGGSSSSITDGYAGISYAANSGADVISCSWGGSGYSSTGQNVVTNAWNMGSIVVVAAGNSNVNTQFYPAAYTNALAVASSSSSDAKSSFSNYGTWVDVTAPGSSIYSTIPSNTYGSMSGTSMACPIVAGLCGLMKSLNPGITQTALINCLLNSCDNIDSQNPSYIGQLGAGRINANNAMACVAGTMNAPPNANFTASATSTCTNTPVQFTDMSTNNPTSWSWVFPGGTPASSTQQNPSVTYASPGTYSVTLYATNSNGTSTYSQNNYITVSNTGQVLPYSEGFQGTQFLPAGWTARDAGSTSIFWTRNSTVGYNSTASAFFDNYTLDAAGARDEMWSPKLSFASLSTCTLKFDVAYARYDATYSDTLAVYISTNCGTSWTQLYIKGGNTLSTNGQVDVQNAMFVPTSAQWRTETINLNAYVNQGSVMIAFQNRGRWGQALYLDNINITGTQAQSLPVSAFQPSQASFCAGTCINFTDNSTGSPTSWSWSFPGGTPSSSTQQNPTNICYNTGGTYTASLTVTNQAGSSTSTQTITVNTAAVPVITQSGNTLNSTSASAYQWYLNSNPINGATQQSYNINQSGSYMVCITASNGCTACSSPFQAVLSGMEGNLGEITLELFPNPNNGTFEIHFNALTSDNYTIEIFDAVGKLIQTESIGAFSGNYQKQFDVSGFGAGVYYLTIKNSTGSLTKKVIVF